MSSFLSNKATRRQPPSASFNNNKPRSTAPRLNINQNHRQRLGHHSNNAYRPSSSSSLRPVNDGAGGQVQLMRQQQRAVGQTQQQQQQQENVLKEGQIDMDEGEKLNSLIVEEGGRGRDRSFLLVDLLRI